MISDQQAVIPQLHPAIGRGLMFKQHIQEHGDGTLPLDRI